MGSVIHGASHKAIGFMNQEPAALAVYWIYLARANGENVAWVSARGLAKDTQFHKDTCLKARDWLVKHGALEHIQNYVRPEWRKLDAKERAQKVNFDHAEYFRPTGLLIINGTEYAMLYTNEGAEQEPPEAFDPKPEVQPEVPPMSYPVGHPTPEDSNHRCPTEPDVRSGRTELDINKKQLDSTLGSESNQDSGSSSTVESVDPLALSRSGENPEPAQPAAAIPAPPRNGGVPASDMNPMKDAIALAFGWSWQTMTRSEKGKIYKAAKNLCEAHVKPSEIPGLYAYCKKQFSRFGPNALDSNLSEYRKASEFDENGVRYVDGKDLSNAPILGGILKHGNPGKFAMKLWEEEQRRKAAEANHESAE